MKKVVRYLFLLNCLMFIHQLSVFSAANDDDDDLVVVRVGSLSGDGEYDSDSVATEYTAASTAIKTSPRDGDVVENVEDIGRDILRGLELCRVPKGFAKYVIDRFGFGGPTRLLCNKRAIVEQLMDRKRYKMQKQLDALNRRISAVGAQIDKLSGCGAGYLPQVRAGMIEHRRLLINRLRHLAEYGMKKYDKSLAQWKSDAEEVEKYSSCDRAWGGVGAGTDATKRGFFRRLFSRS